MVLLLLFLSIINSDIKGFIYLFGVILLFGIMFCLQYANPPNNEKLKNECSLFAIRIFKYPSFISAIYTFTITYLFYAMLKNETINYFFLQ